jgi:hypothetical protein
MPVWGNGKGSSLFDKVVCRVQYGENALSPLG